MYYPVLTNSYKIASLSPYKPKIDTFISPQNMQNYLLYLNINIEFDTITCIHYIHPSLITIMGNIYPDNMLNIQQHVIKKSITMFIENNEKLYTNDKIKNKNFIGPSTQIAVINYGNTLETASDEMRKYAYSANKKLINLLCIIHIKQ
jgi:hypothetical protein